MIYVGYLKVLCPATCCVCFKRMLVDQMHYYLEGSTYFCSNMCVREWMDEYFWEKHRGILDEIHDYDYV